MRSADVLEVAEAHGQAVAARLAGSGWRKVDQAVDGAAYEGRVNGQPLLVVWSVGREDDGRLWLHVSASHRARVPRWDEMAAVKRLFMGEHRWAAELHPPASQHINLHPHCLHLFGPAYPEEWPLPDFARGGGTI